MIYSFDIPDNFSGKIPVKKFSATGDLIAKGVVENLFSTPKNSFPGFLPLMVRSISVTKDHYGSQNLNVIIEQPPRTIPISYSQQMDPEYRDQYDEDMEAFSVYHGIDVNLPWCHYFLTFNKLNNTDNDYKLQSMSLYWSQTKIESPDHIFFSAPLPNQFSSNYHEPYGNVLGFDEQPEAFQDISPSIGEIFGRSCHSFPDTFSISLDTEVFFDKLNTNWNKIFSSFWFGRSFNADTFEAMEVPFNYLFGDTYPEDYVDFMRFINKMNSFETLSEEFFNPLVPALRYMEYLQFAAKHSVQKEYNFQELVNNRVETCLSPVVPGEDSRRVYLDKNGYWRDSKGQFAKVSGGEFAGVAATFSNFPSPLITVPDPNATISGANVDFVYYDETPEDQTLNPIPDDYIVPDEDFPW